MNIYNKNKYRNKKTSYLFKKLRERWLLEKVTLTSCDFFAIRKPTLWEELKNTSYVIDFSNRGDYFVASSISDCVSSENFEFEIWFSKSDWNIIWAFNYNRHGKIEKMREEQILWVIESLFNPLEYTIHLAKDNKNK